MYTQTHTAAVSINTFFKPWAEMTVLEQYASQYWDMFKDAHGVRPRGVNTTEWTEARFEAEFEVLGRVIEREEADRKVREAEAVVAFEDRVANLMHTGTNRERVIAWLMAAEGAEGDAEHFCYCVGLPYNYLS